MEIRIERKIKKKRKFEWKLAEFRFVETCVARLTESRQSARSNTRYNNAANKHERRETDEFAMKSEFRCFPANGITRLFFIFFFFSLSRVYSLYSVKSKSIYLLYSFDLPIEARCLNTMHGHEGGRQGGNNR